MKNTGTEFFQLGQKISLLGQCCLLLGQYRKSPASLLNSRGFRWSFIGLFLFFLCFLYVFKGSSVFQSALYHEVNHFPFATWRNHAAEEYVGDCHAQ